MKTNLEQAALETLDTKQETPDLEEINRLFHERLAQARSNAKLMQEDLVIKPAPLRKKSSLILEALKVIPFANGLLHSIDGGGFAITKLIEIKGDIASPVEHANKSFHIIGAIVASIDFLRIPAIYLASFIVNKKPPFTLSKNAEWAYSAVLLGLTIATLVVPALAPPIGLASAVLVFSVSIITLGNLFYKRYQHTKALKATNEKIEEEEQYLSLIKEDAKNLTEKLKNNLDNPEVAQQLTTEIEKLHAKYLQKSEVLQTLHDEKAKYQQKLDKRGVMAVVDKTVGIGLAALAVAGAALAFFFPPVGVALLAVSALGGGLYVAGRFAAPHLMKLGKRIFGKANKQEIQEPVVSTDPTEEPSEISKLKLTSTTQIYTDLYGKKASEQINNQLKQDGWMDKMDKILGASIELKDSRAILHFFKSLASEVQAYHINEQDVGVILDNLKQGATGIKELGQVLDKVSRNKILLSEEDKSKLFISPSLQQALLDKGVDLNVLKSENRLPGMASGTAEIKLDEEDGDGEREAPR